MTDFTPTPPPESVPGAPSTPPPVNPGMGVPTPGFQASPPALEPGGWGKRLAAYLIDLLLVGAVTAIGYVFLIAGVAAAPTETVVVRVGNQLFEETRTGELPIWSLGLTGLFFLAGFAVGVWNHILRQGRTGQTVGRKVMGISLVAEATGAPLGIGGALGRVLLSSILMNFCFADLIVAFVDDRGRRLSDKIMKSIVVTTPS